MTAPNILILAVSLIITANSIAATWVASPGKGSHAAAAGGLTVVSAASNNDSGAADPTQTSHSLSGVPAGAFLVVSVAIETDSGTIDECTVSDTQGLVWTQRGDAQASSSGNAEIWTATFAAGGSTTITCAWDAIYNGPCSSVVYVITGQETVWGGDSDTATAQSQPSVTSTTTRANSLIICVSSGWNAISGAATYRTPSSISPTQTDDHYVSGRYHAFHYYYQATSATSYVVGMTAPTGQGAGTVAVEVRIP